MKESCPVFQTANFIGKRWTMVILLELYKGDNPWKRYSQLKKRLPNITPKILSTRLKELKEEGLIEKQIDSTFFPIKSEYALTKSGEAFIDIIKDIKKWALTWKIKNEECCKRDCKMCPF